MARRRSASRCGGILGAPGAAAPSAVGPATGETASRPVKLPLRPRPYVAFPTRRRNDQPATTATCSSTGSTPTATARTPATRSWSRSRRSPISGATITTGEWFSYYDRETWTDASDVDIDHLVALAEAWDSGAWDWTPDTREASPTTSATGGRWSPSPTTSTSPRATATPPSGCRSSAPAATSGSGPRSSCAGGSASTRPRGRTLIASRTTAPTARSGSSVHQLTFVAPSDRHARGISDAVARRRRRHEAGQYDAALVAPALLANPDGLWVFDDDGRDDVRQRAHGAHPRPSTSTRSWVSRLRRPRRAGSARTSPSTCR